MDVFGQNWSNSQLQHHVYMFIEDVQGKQQQKNQRKQKNRTSPKSMLDKGNQQPIQHDGGS